MDQKHNDLLRFFCAIRPFLVGCLRLEGVLNLTFSPSVNPFAMSPLVAFSPSVITSSPARLRFKSRVNYHLQVYVHNDQVAHCLYSQHFQALVMSSLPLLHHLDQ